MRFLLFLAVVLAVHWSLKRTRARKLWLLAASYAFYAAWDWRFLALILLSTAVDYAAGLGIATARSPRTQRAWLVTSLVVNLGMLGIFKYYDFFGQSAVELGRWLGLPLSHTTLDLVLPVGISFYTFQSMSYTLDIHRGTLRPTRDFLDLALFVGFFPQLVAGPIVRAANFLPQLTTPRSPLDVPLRACLVLFLVGFVKKACISDNLSPFVDTYFANPSAWDASGAWLAALSYAVQIYCDFSGYSDMAIASAGLLGYRLGANFRAPYLTTNIASFWRHWHISLSSWLRDYLFIPLGGSRGPRLTTYRNLLITMVLGGLWHGASGNFLIWGLLHGFALIVHREWKRHVGEGRLPEILGLALTFWWVCVAWIFFRATNLATALEICRSFVLFESPGSQSADPHVFFVLGALALAQIATQKLPIRDAWRQIPAVGFAVLYGVLFGLAFAFDPIHSQPFIYFQF